MPWRLIDSTEELWKRAFALSPVPQLLGQPIDVHTRPIFAQLAMPFKGHFSLWWIFY